MRSLDTIRYACRIGKPWVFVSTVCCTYQRSNDGDDSNTIPTISLYCIHHQQRTKNKMIASTRTDSSSPHTGKDPFVASMAALREILAKKQQSAPAPASNRKASTSEAQYELQLAEIQKKLAEESGKVISLLQKLENANAELENATTRQYEIQMERNYAQDAVQEKEKEITSLQEELEGVRELNSNLQEQLISSEQENQRTIESLQNQILLVENRNGELSQQLDELEQCQQEELELIEAEAKLKRMAEQTNESSALLQSRLSRMEVEYNLKPPTEGEQGDNGAANRPDKEEEYDDEVPRDEEDDEVPPEVEEVEDDHLEKPEEDDRIDEVSNTQEKETAESEEQQNEYYTQNEDDAESEENREEQNDNYQYEELGEEGEDEEMAEAEVASVYSGTIEENDEDLDDVESEDGSHESRQGEIDSEDDSDDDDVEIVDLQDDNSSSKRSRSGDETDGEEVEMIGVQHVGGDSGMDNDKGEPERKKNRMDEDADGDDFV